MNYLGVRVSAVIEASIESIWAVVSDVTRHPDLAGSGEVQHVEWRTAPGANGIFKSRQMIQGLRYPTESHVVVWEPPYRFAWQIRFPSSPTGLQIWQFALSSEGSGTRVENSVVLPVAIPSVWPLTDLSRMGLEQEVRNMKPTFINLARILSAHEPEAMTITYAPPANTAALFPTPLLQGAVWLGAGVGLALWAVKSLGGAAEE